MIGFRAPKVVTTPSSTIRTSLEPIPVAAGFYLSATSWPATAPRLPCRLLIAPKQQFRDRYGYELGVPINWSAYETPRPELKGESWWLAQPGAPKPVLANEKPQGATIAYDDLVRSWQN